MLKTIFEKIELGKNNFSKEEIKLLEKFISKRIVLINENDKFEINSKYKVGVLKLEKNRAVLESLTNEHKNIKLDFSNLNGAYDQDLVLAKRVFNPRSRIKAKIIEVLSGKAKKIMVYVKANKLHTIKENICLENSFTKDYKEGDVLLVENKTLELIEKLGNLSEAKVDEKISLYLYNESIRLKKPLEVEASMNDRNERIDLRELPFCTIDPNSAKDHDDAIYYDEKNEILYVAIADVSYFVKEGSELDDLAYLKSTSLYLPSKVLPMLPNTLSEDMCSLKEGVDRYSYVFKIYLDTKNQGVKKSQLFEAVINSHKKFSYGRIDRVLEGHLDLYSSIEKEIFDSLISLYKVTKAYRAKRLEKGYDFRSIELRQKLKNNEIVSIEEEHSTASHQLVEECMLLANIEASKKVNSVGIYRIHEEPAFKAISKLVDDVNLLGLKVKLQSDVHSTVLHIQNKAKASLLESEVDELIIQAQTQAKYSSSNMGHFGLGFKSYSHFTSPIRRYSDLVLHRILKSKQTPKNIDDICEHISIQERKVDQLVWDYEDRKYARWAAKNIGEDIKVKITDIERSRAICYDKMKGLKVVIDNYKGQKLYTKLKVKIKEADIVTKTIIASIKY